VSTASHPRHETGADLRRVEAMVTGILNRDPIAQAVAGEGLTDAEERYVRAGASIVASHWQAIAQTMGLSPSRMWREQLAIVTASRSERGDGG
jgi:hypothetical protein